MSTHIVIFNTMSLWLTVRTAPLNVTHLFHYLALVHIQICAMQPAIKKHSHFSVKWSLEMATKMQPEPGKCHWISWNTDRERERQIDRKRFIDRQTERKVSRALGSTNCGNAKTRDSCLTRQVCISRTQQDKLLWAKLRIKSVTCSLRLRLKMSRVSLTGARHPHVGTCFLH